MIDPRKRQERRGGTPGVRLPGDLAPLAVVVGLAIEVAPLVPLAGWPPCGQLLEELVGMARGGTGLSLREVHRLRVWTKNWTHLAADVRRFYAGHHDHPDVDRALWWVLGTRRNRPASWPVRNAYTTRLGHEPAVDLLPRPTTQEQ